MKFRYPPCLTIAALLLATGCNLGQPTGGGTGVDGLTGTLVVPTGTAAAGASVKVYTAGSLEKASAGAGNAALSDPIAQGATHAIPFDSAVADAAGRFSFPDLAEGTYTLVASYARQGDTFVLLLSGVVVSGQTQLGLDTLRLSGSLTVNIEEEDTALAGADCKLTGTPFHASLDSSGRCILTDLPSGTFELTIETADGSGGVVGDFLVVPGTVTDGGTRPLPGGTEPPPAPALVVPANAALLVQGDSLAWTFFTGVTGYHLQIALGSDSNFLAPVFDDTLPESRHTVESSPAETYAWRVRALNTAGPGPWSVVRMFVIADTSDTTGTGVPATHFGVTASTVALWTFDTLDTLNRYPDLSGNGRHLSAPPSGTLTQSPLGMAVSFTGGQYSSVTGDDTLVMAATPVLTYEARIWLDAYPSSSLQHGAATVMGQYGGLRMIISHDGRISVDGQTDVDGAWAWYGPVTDTGVMPVGQWVDVAVAADGQEGHLYLYVNGVAVQTYNNIAKGSFLRHLTTAEYPFTLGNDSQDNQPFPGKIDEIRISNGLVLGPGFVPIVQPVPGR